VLPPPVPPALTACVDQVSAALLRQVSARHVVATGGFFIQTIRYFPFHFL
jgi:hypothetical protein